MHFFWPLGPDGQAEIALRHTARAKRLILRHDPVAGLFRLTVPKGLRRQDVGSFLKDQEHWLRRQLRQATPRTPLQDGAVIPFLGRDHEIRHSAQPHLLPVRREADRIIVTGPAGKLSQRLTRWLKSQARQDLAPRVTRFAAALNRPVPKISLRDTSSRWGSCSSSGNISLCWRLVFAPAPVRDYVCAHEACHLCEMNHSRRFWALLDGLIDAADRQRAWLKQNGQSLHMIG